MKSRQKILIIGFGDVAERLARLLDSRQRIYALVRKPERAARARDIGIVPIGGDLADRTSLRRLAGLADTVFHLAPPPNRGPRDHHTRNLIAALSRPAASGRPGMLPQHLVYISTTGVYGDCGGRQIDETQARHPQTERALRRADAETALRAWGRRSGVAIAILRAPGIYAADRLPIERLQKGTPALAPDDDVFTNHIHADDLARAAWRAAYRAQPNRVYNAVDNSEMRMGEYFDLVADWFNLPHPRRVSRAEAGAHIGAAMLSFMNESRRIGNVRLTRELGMRLRYPTVNDFLDSLKSG
ncbi:MAG TPA: NAD-dependent epimerase/dehydratase family protein [Usitatibacteraceae bacterium]